MVSLRRRYVFWACCRTAASIRRLYETGVRLQDNDDDEVFVGIVGKVFALRISVMMRRSPAVYSTATSIP